MMKPRKTCPVCRAPIWSSFRMLSDRSVTADGDEDWVRPETKKFLVRMDAYDLTSCRQFDEVNIDICTRCETVFS